MPTETDNTLLQMALVGFEAEHQKIQNKITEIQRELPINRCVKDALRAVLEAGRQGCGRS